MNQVISIDDLDYRAIIAPNDVVVCGQATAEPLTLTEALVRQQRQLPPFKVMIGPLFTTAFTPDATAGMQFISYGVMGGARTLAKAGRLAVVSSSYSSFCADVASGTHRADVVLIQLSSRIRDRGLNLGLSNDYVLDAARRARVVIAELNPDAPWTFGGEFPPDIRIDLAIPARRRPAEVASADDDDIASRIAAHVANLVPDGATVQMGIGKIPDIILSRLSEHRNLGIHSGMISDAMVELLQRGAVTNAEKGIDLGVTVSNQVIGTRKLYDFVHDNPEVAVRPASYTHNHAILAQVRKLTAINSALQVGCDGSINAEALNGRTIGAVGGQIDFVRGARASPGGRSIIALPSSSNGTSRIVTEVEVVTTARSDADTIVTEWGVAHLAGCDLEERARRMVRIAAPEHRDVLRAKLRERGVP